MNTSLKFNDEKCQLIEVIVRKVFLPQIYGLCSPLTLVIVCKFLIWMQIENFP
jgi:hypothetical protein